MVSEQLAMYRNMEQAISGLEMSSAKGKEIHAKLKSGLPGMIAVLENYQKLDLASPEGMVKANALNPKV